MDAQFKKIGLMLIFCIVFAWGSVGFASSRDKLVRGVQNMVVFPAEIPKHAVREASKAPSDILVPFYGGFYGMPKGAAYGVSRAVSGVVDFLTSPFNAPRDWKSTIPMDKFTFEETPETINS